MASNTLMYTVSMLLLVLSGAFVCEATLSPKFYDSICPNAATAIRKIVRTAVSRERRMAASLLRLQFHDCFVQGCDGSVLLDETATIRSEKFSFANNNSVRGFNVIEEAKNAVEKLCPRKFSCADIVALAARDATVAVGGPSWMVKLGRRDSTTANRALADRDLPNSFHDLPVLISRFAAKGLNTREMVALSGSHTLGQSRCIGFRARIYGGNGTNIDPNFARTRRRGCPPTGGGGDFNLAPLDLVTPNSFDNNYFRNLQQRKGLLNSDQVLFTGASGPTDNIVLDYIKSPKVFASEFAAAMVKMGDISPLTGKNGIIRRVCSSVN